MHVRARFPIFPGNPLAAVAVAGAGGAGAPAAGGWLTLASSLSAAGQAWCLGDVGHPEAWWDDGLVLDVAECPGERVLVLGNHDRDVAGLRRAGFHKTCRTALCATTPPLVRTHIPLLKVPAGAVNVHGHLHRAAGPTDRHVNVSVEHTDYAPVGLTYVLGLAWRPPEPNVATLRLDLPSRLGARSSRRSRGHGRGSREPSPLRSACSSSTATLTRPTVRNQRPPARPPPAGGLARPWGDPWSLGRNPPT